MDGRHIKIQHCIVTNCIAERIVKSRGLTKFQTVNGSESQIYQLFTNWIKLNSSELLMWMSSSVSISTAKQTRDGYAYPIVNTYHMVDRK